MIRYADDATRAQVYNMWKTVFGDSDEYMDLYFREKYRNENTLVYFEGEKAVSSLQMLPFCFSFHGREIPIAYFSGLCTLPEARRKGFMAALIEKAFGEMGKKGVPLAMLVPQDEPVMTFYSRFGFTQTFDAGTETLPSLQDLTQRYPGDLYAAFREFDSLFRHKDMTVQKSFDDFRTMVEEAALSGFPPKRNLMGMARMIDLQRLLSLFADRHPQATFSVSVQDELFKENCGSFTITEGKAEKDGPQAATCFHANIRKLTQWLFGYHTSENEEPLRTVFPEKVPSIGFMLE